jgi:DNA polymerase mu
VHAETPPLFPLFAQLTFHIIPAKLDGELSKVYGWIEDLGGECVALDQALFVVTALRGRARLKKAIGRPAMVSAE